MPNLRTSGKRNLAECVDMQPPNRPKEVASPRPLPGVSRRMRPTYPKLTALLIEWAWRKEQPLEGLGYAEQTPEVTLMEYRCKVSGGASSGIFPEWDADEAFGCVEHEVGGLPFEQEIIIRAKFERGFTDQRLRQLVKGYEKIYREAMKSLDKSLRVWLTRR